MPEGHMPPRMTGLAVLSVRVRGNYSLTENGRFLSPGVQALFAHKYLDAAVRYGSWPRLGRIPWI